MATRRQQALKGTMDKHGEALMDLEAEPPGGVHRHPWPPGTQNASQKSSGGGKNKDFFWGGGV